MVEPAELMRLAIQVARDGIEAGQTPFGCAIARGDEILAANHNIVLATTDITAHAEVNAIREACRQTNHILLESTIVATTCEPCPMCMAALHWARVDTVYYGASIDDAAAAGFRELQLGAADLTDIGRSDVRVVPDLLSDDCRALFTEWRARPDATAY